MRNNRVCGALAAVALMAAIDGAYAATVPVDCSANPGALAALLASGGTAGDVYQINGTCTGDITITQSNITITGADSNYNIVGTINGSLIITGASNILLQSVRINGSAGYYGGVYISRSASVEINYSIIQNGGAGVFVLGPASAGVENTTIQHNIGNSSSGGGLHAIGGAFIYSYGNVITGNEPVGVLAEQNSTVYLEYTDVTGPSNNHTVLLSQGSRAFIDFSQITADTPFNANNQFAVIAVQDNSSAVLAGENTITNSAPGGAAVIVSGASILKEEAAWLVTDAPRGVAAMISGASIPKEKAEIAYIYEIINGDGRIQTQSVIEVGALFGDFPFTWNGNIFLSQASSFRADGANVTINGTLTLDQASNGYFNNFNGTTNDITKVVCNSTTDHVSNPNLVSPPITIGPPPGCALF